MSYAKAGSGQAWPPGYSSPTPPPPALRVLKGGRALPHPAQHVEESTPRGVCRGACVCVHSSSPLVYHRHASALSLCLSCSQRKEAQVSGSTTGGEAGPGSHGGCCLFSWCPLTSFLLGCFRRSPREVRFPLKFCRSRAHVWGERCDPGPRDVRALAAVSQAQAGRESQT